jgi:amidohydrolase
MLTGSFRTQSDDDRNIYIECMNRICTSAALKHAADVRFVLVSGVKRVLNHPTLEAFTTRALSKVAPIVSIDMGLGGEDFYNFSDARPSSYFLVGCSLIDDVTKQNNPYPHHSSLFQFDERALLVGARAWLSIIE